MKNNTSLEELKIIQDRILNNGQKSKTSPLSSPEMNLKPEKDSLPIQIAIKPLSVNECWRGRRFKTPKYSIYEKELLIRLIPMKLPEPPYEIAFTFGVSTKNADWDNPIKPIQDILQKKYKFNDKDIYRAVVEKKIVKKGNEFFSFHIKHLHNI